MTAKTIVITGASDGIGAVSARTLAADGHRVIVVGRSPDKTRAVGERLGAPWYVADFSRLADVRALAGALRADHPDIDVLVNNAGAVMGARRVTVDGHELTLQVNHLAPFLLTNLLMDRLLERRASVITTSSIAHRLLARFDIDDLENEHHYSARRAYGDSKLMNVLFTRELDRRFAARGLSAASLHPGNVATNFSVDSTWSMRLIYRTPLRRVLLISADRGSDTLSWLAEGTPGIDWQSGTYYDKRKPGRLSGPAQDDDLARQLWERSAAMVGLTGPKPE